MRLYRAHSTAPTGWHNAVKRAFEKRDIAVLAEAVRAARDPSMNRVYAECDVQEALDRELRNRSEPSFVKE